MSDLWRNSNKKPNRIAQLLKPEENHKIDLPVITKLKPNNFVMPTLSTLPHLCFKQVQPKMCHSPKVDDGVKKKKIYFLNTFFEEQ